MPVTTVLYADQANSTTQLTRLGDERARPLRREMFEMLREAVSEHGGRVVDNTGDGAVCAFDSSVAAADSALAVQSATALLNTSRTEAERLGVRIGLHAGEPVEGEDGRLFGAAIVVAARLCAIARPGQILASETIRTLAEPAGQQSFHLLGRMLLKGLTEPTTIFEVTGRGMRRAKHPIALAPVGGLVFVALMVALSLLPTGPTSLEPTDAELARFFVESRELTLVSAGINVVAIGGAVAFTVSLSRALARSALGAAQLASATFWAGIIGAALALFGLALSTLPAFRLAEAGDLSAIRTLWDLSIFVGALSFAPLALLAGMASFGALRWKLLPPWLCYLGIALALSAAVTGGLVLVDLEVSTVAWLLTYWVFLVWVASASGALMQSPTLRS